MTQKLKALRAQMKTLGIDAYLVPSADAHMSEYVPQSAERRAWLSGFTGSAGELVVTSKDAGLWTDGRYFIQAADELAGSGIKLMKMMEPGVPSRAEFLCQNIKSGGVVGYDAKLLSISAANAMRGALSDKGIKFKALSKNLVDAIWQDRPTDTGHPIAPWPETFSGEGHRQKLGRIRAAMKSKGADAHVLTMLDAIAWAFNIRGSDVDFNPVVIAYAIITAKSARLFVDPKKVTPALKKHLGKSVELVPYKDFGKALTALPKEAKSVWLEESTCSDWVAQKLKRCKQITARSCVTDFKAEKNSVELEGIRNAHRRDGVAMVRFLCWLENAMAKGGVTEISAADALQGFRAEGEHFRGLSFRTISGYAAHGAIVHYSVDEKSNIPLKNKGIYLVDSGGQYLDGTTDITRTLLLGDKASAEEKDRYTRVLKGHIHLATAKFPAGVNGIRLDTLARSALWQAGLDYGHGTGHGVGAYLNVHEGPQSISHRGYVPLQVGNVLSNEPGYYKDGAYGIRIENLVTVVEAEGFGQDDRKFLGFETLTLCPIDTRLIEPKLLSEGERKWLNDYHARVYKELAPHLEAAQSKWLKAATAAI